MLNEAIATCTRLFEPHGRLSTALPDFTPRSSQIILVRAIAKSIFTQSILVAEAGTGTGKTYAYLAPSLLSGKKVLISTATKTLQDQLNEKDLPGLIKALGLGVRVQNLKGRSNYLCHYRTHLNALQGQFSSPTLAHDIIKVRAKLPRLKRGERSELPEIKEDSALWPYVTSTVDNCLGTECEYQQDCFLGKARKRALTADVVIINHHLFFADSRLKEEGLGELLPNVEVVIFDEAHQLTDIATHFYGERFSTNQLKELVDDLISEWPFNGAGTHPVDALRGSLDELIHNLLHSIPEKEDRYTWKQLEQYSLFQGYWQSVINWLLTLKQCIEDGGLASHAGVMRCLERLKAIQLIAMHLNQPQEVTLIRWVERFKQSLVFHATPLDVAGAFSTLLGRAPGCAFIFTSATLTMASSFDCFTKPLGLSKAETLLLPSPFDFKNQALLYLPRDMPDPYDKHYYDILLTKVLPIIEACGGRAFFLFTSHRALRLVAERLYNHLQYPLLVQGDESKPLLLARFRQLGNAVLLGTATFWEGVDVKGEALSCVIIDKLPFASPADPITQGRIAYLKSQGLSAFDELTLPAAVLALKQGVGRLIRDVLDKGVLVIADPRLIARNYGRQLFESLPPLRKTRDEQTVLDFIQSW
ncbi:MAG: ATP-dependent DNA helicase DinG [Legionellales bacterium RIFCSPHIGHO2_12_FULL_42_9]|nr:MAG: ATP-dependent DNA helicase DinG [Legionellales bacterium RIFCSPHIGHO2_12_FULL_42_9]